MNFEGGFHSRSVNSLSFESRLFQTYSHLLPPWINLTKISYHISPGFFHKANVDFPIPTLLDKLLEIIEIYGSV